MYAPQSSLIGGSSIGNGRALSTEMAQRAGVAIGGSGVVVSGHTFSFFPTTLHYIHLTGTLANVDIGHNTYEPGIAMSAIVGSTAFTAAGAYTTMAGGLGVHTNAPTAPGLALYDVLETGPAIKVLRVSGGNLQVLNAAGSTPIHQLSDVGTPSWVNRRGQAAVTGASATVTVTLSPAEPDASYFVQLTPVQTGGAPTSGAYNVKQVAKSAGSFEIEVTTAPGGGNTVIFDWLVYR